ncbi:2-hydroxyglutaryl-CoA dehydratase, partial [bacterium]|nr:2-hydroxyglutaryl-CoA dehydratase [bacterium]
MLKAGIDIGSTTIKCVVTKDDSILYQAYERHYSKAAEKAKQYLRFVSENFAKNQPIQLAVSGSAGMGLAESLGIPFFQEVYCTRIAVKSLVKDADAVIELGGEDAKILFLTGTNEVRMNGSCAGGTGAFIDQMATLLNVTLEEMNELAKNSKKLYT